MRQSEISKENGDPAFELERRAVHLARLGEHFTWRVQHIIATRLRSAEEEDQAIL